MCQTGRNDERLPRGPPRDSTVKRWTPLPSAFLASPAFPADFGDLIPRIFSIIFDDSRNNILVDLLKLKEREDKGKNFYKLVSEKKNFFFNGAEEKRIENEFDKL